MNATLKQFFVMTSAFAVALVVALIVLIGIVFWLNQTKEGGQEFVAGASQQEQELVMDDGNLFSCKNYGIFSNIARIFDNETMPKEERVAKVMVIIQLASASSECLFLSSPLFISSSSVIGERDFVVRGVPAKISTRVVRVHQKGSEKLFYSIVMRYSEGNSVKNLDFVFFSLVALGLSLDGGSGDFRKNLNM